MINCPAAIRRSRCRSCWLDCQILGVWRPVPAVGFRRPDEGNVSPSWSRDLDDVAFRLHVSLRCPGSVQIVRTVLLCHVVV